VTVRAGIGYDAHRLVEGRPLILGGVRVPFHKGLLGHSDGDALVHAIIDALLGAAHMGDMGSHFPSSNPSYKDADSGVLLERVAELLRGGGWMVVNVDATMVAERPVLAPYIDAMRQELARRLGVDRDLITIKAKTNDGLGFLGAGEGMAAWAVALLQEPA
jgi:2-C-methyl-D-erythritol 2,4-cyclodiphosphate synthase